MIFIFNHIPHASMKFESPLTKAQMETFHELIRIFGCETWYVVEGTNNSVCRGRRGILLGISELKMGYDILDIESRTVIQCRNVMFNEVSMPFLIGLKPCKIMHPGLRNVVAAAKGRNSLTGLIRSVETRERGGYWQHRSRVSNRNPPS